MCNEGLRRATALVVSLLAAALVLVGCGHSRPQSLRARSEGSAPATTETAVGVDEVAAADAPTTTTSSRPTTVSTSRRVVAAPSTSPSVATEAPPAAVDHPGLPDLLPPTAPPVVPDPLLTLFPVAAKSDPLGITVGPDGALWFTESSTPGWIGRITVDGVLREFHEEASRQPLGLTVGADGNLWFEDAMRNSIVRMTTSGMTTDFPLGNQYSSPEGAMVGGAEIWFTERSSSTIGKVTMAGVVTEYLIPGGAVEQGLHSLAPRGIVRTGDGRLWFTRAGGLGWFDGVDKWGFLNLGRGAQGLTVGLDGSLWFGAAGTDPARPSDGALGHVALDGTVSYYEIPTAFSHGGDLATGRDGSIWFTEPVPQKIGRFDPHGTFTEWSAPQPWGIVTNAPDGHVWVTTTWDSHIARLRIDA
jgi:virginiamycin B lyase